MLSTKYGILYKTGLGINDESKKKKKLINLYVRPYERNLMLTPFQKFLSGLNAAQLEFNETMDELRGFAEILARKQNNIELDEDGLFYVTATGPLPDVIDTVEKQLIKLKRINDQRISPH